MVRSDGQAEPKYHEPEWNGQPGIGKFEKTDLMQRAVNEQSKKEHKAHHLQVCSSFPGYDQVDEQQQQSGHCSFGSRQGHIKTKSADIKEHLKKFSFDYRCLLPGRDATTWTTLIALSKKPPSQ